MNQDYEESWRWMIIYEFAGENGLRNFAGFWNGFRLSTRVPYWKELILSNIIPMDFTSPQQEIKSADILSTKAKYTSLTNFLTSSDLKRKSENYFEYCDCQNIKLIELTRFNSHLELWKWIIGDGSGRYLWKWSCDHFNTILFRHKRDGFSTLTARWPDREVKHFNLALCNEDFSPSHPQSLHMQSTDIPFQSTVRGQSYSTICFLMETEITGCFISKL